MGAQPPLTPTGTFHGGAGTTKRGARCLLLTLWQDEVGQLSAESPRRLQGQYVAVHGGKTGHDGAFCTGNISPQFHTKTTGERIN